MKKLNFFLLFMVLVVINAYSQFQLNTVPPLNGGNGSAGITFNLTAHQSIIVDSLFATFSSTGNTEIWYSTTAINGSPTIDAVNGWTQLATPSVTQNANGDGSISPINYDLGLLIPAGQTYAFYIDGSSGAPLRYTTGTSGVSAPFTDGNITIETGNLVGYGGSRPNPGFHPRQFNGGVKYTIVGGANDAAVLSVDSPYVFCSGNHNVVATIGNFGQNQIDSVDVEWEVNGVAQPTYQHIGLLDTLNGSNPNSIQLTLGSASFNVGTNDLKVWTSMPNGLQDTSNFNDTINVTVTSAAAPIAVSTYNATLNSVTVDAVGGAGTVDYEYGPLGFAPGTGTAGSSPTPTFTITGLSQGSTYDVYVRSNCGSGDVSAWVGPETFNTSYGVPYAQDFENFTAGITGNPWPEGWSSTTTTDPNWESEDATGANENSTGTGPLYDHTIFGQSGGMYVYMETSGGTTGDSADFVSPPIYVDSTLSTVELSYWYFNHGADIDRMYVIVDTNGVENVVATYTGQQQANQTDPWLQGSHFLNGYQGKSVVIKFRGFNVPCCSGDLAIDDVRLDPVLPINAGVVELQSPSGSLCPGSITPIVGVKNFGSNILDSVNVVWDVNGVIDSLTYVGQIMPGDTASVSLATLNITSTQVYDMEFYTSQPNAQNDQFHADDTLEVNGLQTGLSGAITVDATQPASATNFQNFSSLTQVLNNYGVCGPTTVDVAVGVYNESIYLSNIPGLSATNYLQISGTDSSQTIVRHDGSVNYATLTFDGVSHVSVKNMTIEMTASGDAVIFANGAEHDTLSNSVSRVDATSTSSAIYNISFSGNPQGNATGADANYNVVQNNRIIGGYYGIRLYGASTNLNTYNQIVNNEIDSVYYYGIYSYYQDSIEVVGNSIDMLSRGNTNADGGYMYYSNNTRFSKNYIWAGDYGVRFYNSSTYAPIRRKFEISNNMIYSETDYGVYMYSVDSANIWHNSVHVEGTSTPAIYISESTSSPITDYDLRNNIFSSINTEALETGVPDTIFDKFNNNVYYTQNGTNVLNIDGTGYATLAAYQTAQPLYNTASLEGDPEFVSNLDFHIVGAFVDDGGDNSVGITEDIDGDVRPSPNGTAVDIGADEFDPPTCPSPGNPYIDSVGSYSAIAYWTPNTFGNTIEYELVSCGDSLGTGIQGVSTIDSVLFNGLNSSSCYEFYLREICTRGDTSLWSGPYAFNTLLGGPKGVNCITGNQTTVFTEEFDNLNAWTGDIGTGATIGDWNSRSGTTGSGSTGPSGAHSGNNYVYAETSGGGSNSTFSIVSPLIDLTQASDSAELSFWMHAYGATIGTLNVNVSTSQTGPFTTLFTWSGELQTAETDPYQQVGIRLDSYVGQSIYIEFEYLSGSSYTGDIAVDLMEIKSCVSCPSPSNQSVSNVSLTSADLDWVENGTATDWEIEYGTAGFPIGTGTTVATTQKPYSLTGLTASTAYEFYVRAVCSPGDTSGWEGPFAFNTSNGVPYLEDFETFTAGNFSNPWPNGWTSTTTTDPNWESEDANGSNENSTGTGPLYDHTIFGQSGGIYMYMETSGGTVGDSADFVSPPIFIDSSMNVVELSYWYFFHGADIDGMNVIIDTNGVETVVASVFGQQQPNQTDPWLKDSVDLVGYAGQSIQIKFRGYNVPCCSGDIAIDDVALDVVAPIDGAILALDEPLDDSLQCYTASENVSVELFNGGANPLDFTTDTADITVNVSGATTQNLSFTVNDNTLNGGVPLGGGQSINVPMGTIDMTTVGTYYFNATVSIDADGNSTNDNLMDSIVVLPQSGGLVSGNDTICIGDTITVATDDYYGSIQWQEYDGTNWVNITGATSPTVDVDPLSTTEYRVLACGSVPSDTAEIYVYNISAPTAVGDTALVPCGNAGTAVVDLINAFPGSHFEWYDSSQAGNQITTGGKYYVSNLGDTLTYTDSTTSTVTSSYDTVWVEEVGGSGGGPSVLITEFDPSSPDMLELQNVSNSSVDVTGWSLAISDDYNNINTVNTIVQTLNGVWSSGQIEFWDDNNGTNDWGNNIYWSQSGNPGWILLIDDQGDIVDFVAWDWTSTDIQGMSVTVNSFTVTPGASWVGDGVDVNLYSTGNSFSRVGTEDNDDKNDFVVQSLSTGTLNANLQLPFSSSCRSSRTMVVVGVDCLVGLEDEDQSKLAADIQVYPNPSNGLFTLDLTTLKVEDFNLSIRDVQGKLIYEEQLNVNGSYRDELDLKGLAKGVYYLQIQNDEASEVKKLIIQ